MSRYHCCAKFCKFAMPESTGAMYSVLIVSGSRLRVAACVRSKRWPSERAKREKRRGAQKEDAELQELYTAMGHRRRDLTFLFFMFACGPTKQSSLSFCPTFPTGDVGNAREPGQNVQGPDPIPSQNPDCAWQCPTDPVNGCQRALASAVSVLPASQRRSKLKQPDSRVKSAGVPLGAPQRPKLINGCYVLGKQQPPQRTGLLRSLPA